MSNTAIPSLYTSVKENIEAYGVFFWNNRYLVELWNGTIP